MKKKIEDNEKGNYGGAAAKDLKEAIDEAKTINKEL